MGIYYDGTTIYIHNDNDGTGGHAVGSAHTFAEIAAADTTGGWGVFTDLGTNRKSYRSQKTIQIGDKVGGTIDATGTAADTTTLVDVNAVVIWDNTKTLQYRATQTSSWTTTLGTKVGTGNEASGVSGCDLTFGTNATFRGNTNLYGCTLRQTSGNISFASGITSSSVGELINCLLQFSSTGAGSITFGTATQRMLNLYNVDISSVTTSNLIIANFFVDTATRLTIAASGVGAMIRSNSTAVGIKDLAIFGTPTTSDLFWGGSSPDWVLVRPVWSNNAPKFSSVGVGLPILGDATLEYWLYDVKCVDGTGAGVSGLPVKVTDNTGVVQINTTTDSEGQISYGSGITTNALVMMDHYTVGTAYTQRHRGPFLTEVNMSYQSGYNPNYFSHRYYWRPPGYDTITTSAGSFEDVTDILQMSAPSSGGSTWTEVIVP